jgi:transposase
MGKRKKHQQQPLFIAAADLPRTAAHPFYAKLNEVLAGWRFDEFVEARCQQFYEDRMGRRSLEPGKYFRLLLIGYFEGIDSERGIAWRCADSLSIRSFVGYGLDETSTEHSTISRTRRLINVETHREVFQWVLKVLADYDLISGKTVGIDATTLEANAAMRSIVRKDNRQNYQAFLTDLARASGIQTPTREDLAKLDKTRKNKASNDWENPNDPDAKIAKMKDGSTHLAHKAEHAVDMESGAVLAVTLQGADLGDTATILPTIAAATENLVAVADDERAAGNIDGNFMSEAVADKGYHPNGTMIDLGGDGRPQLRERTRPRSS